MRKQAWAVMAGVGAAGVVVALSAALTTAQEGDEHGIPEKAPKDLPAPVVSIHDLMELFNEPLYEYLQKAMQEKPTGSEGWKTIAERGLQAAEVINLVAIREMAEEHRQAWPELTRTAMQAGLDLAHAAHAHNWPKTQAAYRALISNCNDCHRKIAPNRAPILKP